ncbi:MAG: cupin domain-containing protein [Balneolales bacterium]
MQLPGLNQKVHAQQTRVQIANLSNGEDADKFNSIRKEFIKRNAGYDMIYIPDSKSVKPQNYTQVVFVQAIDGITNQDEIGNAIITDQVGAKKKSEAIVGDIILLQPGERLNSDVNLGLLVFKVPQKPKNELPGFIRPDWDPNITDIAGGCATEIDAYRRILLTWREDVGEYIYHALNAHRVRIRDSFSHYHPDDIGFDEFYLVQMVEPGAKIITSDQTNIITDPNKVEKSQVDDLMQEYDLEVGDLIYLPRGVIHRGFGGVLAQVITVPGFIPGSEIGVDHHLRAINEKLELNGNEALPYNLEASKEAVIR